MAEDVFRVEPDESPSILFQHTVLAQCCLPYRDPGPEVQVWERSQGAVRLMVQSGFALYPDNPAFVRVGLPYGPKPRLMLAHLNAEALRTGSPEIEVEASLGAFLTRLGLHQNGRNRFIVKDQLTRLAAASIRLAVARSEQEVWQVQAHLICASTLWYEGGRVPVLWPTVVTLDPTYFQSLKAHAVPLHEHALAALAHNAMALDVYAWLAQRLHRVPVGRPQLVPWKALKDQFGWHYTAMFKFRQVFRPTLKLALEQYPSAKLDADERGLLLHWSQPPVLCRRSTVPKLPEAEPPASGG